MIVMCSSLTNPDNGMISCSLGDDGIPSYEDTCIFTCDTGYELTGIRSDARTCQNDGNWSGGNTTCNRGIMEPCQIFYQYHYLLSSASY